MKDFIELNYNNGTLYSLYYTKEGKSDKLTTRVHLVKSSPLPQVKGEKRLPQTGEEKGFFAKYVCSSLYTIRMEAILTNVVVIHCHWCCCFIFLCWLIQILLVHFF